MFSIRHLYNHGRLARKGPIAAHDANKQSHGPTSRSRLRFAGDYLGAAPWLALMTMAVNPAAAQFGLGLSPMRVEMNLAPGAQRNGTVALANDSNERGRYRAEILDLSIDTEAVPQFEKEIPSEAAFSCRNWIAINPMEGEIDAAGHAQVRYTFRVPAGVPARTYHCAVGFTSLPDARQPQSAIGIVALLRLTCTFYITVGNPAPAGEVKQISIEALPTPGPGAPETSGYRAVISVENAGLTNLRGAGKVDLLNESGSVIQAAQFPTVVILPSRTQRIPLILQPKMPEGTYTLRTTVNLGNNEIQEATYKFRVPLTPVTANPVAATRE
jgi:hypothetical protein